MLPSAVLPETAIPFPFRLAAALVEFSFFEFASIQTYSAEWAAMERRANLPARALPRAYTGTAKPAILIRMNDQPEHAQKSVFKDLYPSLSEEELYDAEERLRRYLLLAVDVLDQLAAMRNGESVDAEDLTRQGESE